MTSGPPPICIFCKHYHENNEEALTCDAYPEEIPFDIIINAVDHRRPQRADNGVQFEPKSNEGREYAEEMFAD